MDVENVGFEVTVDELINRIKALQSKSVSYLKPTKKVIVMEGCCEEAHMCYHLKVENLSKHAVTFIVRKPPGRAFNVTPKVGIIRPEAPFVFYVTFNGRAWRAPDDGVYMISIYQAIIHHVDPVKLESARVSSRTGRKYWHKHQNVSCKNILHLPITFEKKKTTPHEEHVDPFKITMRETEKPKHPQVENVIHSSQLPSAAEDGK
ncbi:hypothetical protein M3Y95_00640300 [Aphelenchoides besseyi]|nr:hypothetical protein M3Y95_00640300 [Aphelenchoides besseyi]